jgi:proteasome lid subunit RPN8/RPN11
MSTEPVLKITEAAQTAMVAAASHAHPDETGGILVGVYLEEEIPWVTLAIEIPTTDRGRAHYRIPAGATQPAVLGARVRDSRLGYLGDWHSHPGDFGPSYTDLATLALISIKKPLQLNPTQIIVRRTESGYELDARRFVALTARKCNIVLTGPLPCADR